MTQLLASVTGPEEALLALAGGADVIDLKDPARGAFGAVALDRVRASVAAVAGRKPVSAVTGDGPFAPGQAAGAAEALVEAGVDIVKHGFADEAGAACIDALAPLATRARLVAVVMADRHPDPAALVPRLAAAGFAGAMLDTADKRAGRLLSHMDIPALDGFVRACRDAGLMAGLAGSLEAPDVPRLLVLGPDVLGFRGALCRRADRTDALDPAAIATIRGLIPPEGPRTREPRDLHRLAARHYAPAPRDPAAADRVFVRDLVLSMRVGAYAFERDATQRVRFSVEAAVTRPARPTEGMADVFSYDVITDGIRLLLAAGHVDLLETLAERIAGMLLAHPHVLRVWVRLEKLDVGEGVVGCAIERAREGVP